jgi:phosphatidylglycerol:prolipoprotein diacylglycerol transferase
MRPILIRLLLDRPWEPWVSDVQGVPGIGIAFFVAMLALLALGWLLYRRGLRWTADDKITVGFWAVVIAVLSFVPPMLTGKLQAFTKADAPVTSFPIFGYGTMVLMGFLTATWFGQRRASKAGLDPSIVFDSAFWTLVCGVLGGRLFYLAQHGEEVFRAGMSLGQRLFAAVNLSNGGLVLIGAMLGGAIGYFVACRKRGVAPLMLLDLLTPSIFIGIGFGRIGCLLYGCCFGDPSTLPWAIAFPEGSAAFQTLVERGFVSPEAKYCMPLHPTQIYSAFNGFLLAFVTYTYYPFRRRVGGVFALGLILYPITRFFIEFVRADELGQLGTGLTISQLLSIGLLAVGIGLSLWLDRYGRAPAEVAVRETARQDAASASAALHSRGVKSA